MDKSPECVRTRQIGGGVIGRQREKYIDSHSWLLGLTNSDFLFLCGWQHNNAQDSFNSISGTFYSGQLQVCRCIDVQVHRCAGVLSIGKEFLSFYRENKAFVVDTQKASVSVSQCWMGDFPSPTVQVSVESRVTAWLCKYLHRANRDFTLQPLNWRATVYTA